MPYLGKRTTYLAKGCCIQEKEQPIQRKDAVFRKKNNLSSERMLYLGKRTTYPAKGCCIQEKEQPIQLKDAVFRKKNNLFS
jgi:hypothetical protein